VGDTGGMDGEALKKKSACVPATGTGSR